MSREQCINSKNVCAYVGQLQGNWESQVKYFLFTLVINPILLCRMQNESPRLKDLATQEGMKGNKTRHKTPRNMAKNHYIKFPFIFLNTQGGLRQWVVLTSIT